MANISNSYFTFNKNYHKAILKINKNSMNVRKNKFKNYKSVKINRCRPNGFKLVV